MTVLSCVARLQVQPTTQECPAGLIRQRLSGSVPRGPHPHIPVLIDSEHEAASRRWGCKIPRELAAEAAPVVHAHGSTWRGDGWLRIRSLRGAQPELRMAEAAATTATAGSPRRVLHVPMAMPGAQDRIMLRGDAISTDPPALLLIVEQRRTLATATSRGVQAGDAAWDL